MYVAAVIVEQLEADGHLKRLTMRGSGNELIVAFPNEYEGKPSGPFFFPNEQDEEQFKKGFADCKVLPLTEQSFTKQNGDYDLRIERRGIPTERGQLSYYSLSLPQFAIPSEITVKDPLSNEPRYKCVFKNRPQGRFVIYIECRSRHGVFDFLLEARFKIERDKFGDAEEYKDEYLSPYGGQINAYKQLLSPDQQRGVMDFFLRTKATSSSPERELTAKQRTLFSASADEDNLTKRERKGKFCAQIIEEMKQIKHMYVREGLTILDIEAQYKDFEVWGFIKNLKADDRDHFKLPSQWEATVGYAHSLLSKKYGNEKVTIRDCVKAYRYHIKAKK